MVTKVCPPTPFAAGGRVAVLSPHMDDAVLSLGATIARASSAGCEVVVVSVFASDPESTLPAAKWERACGFDSAGEAAARRREEDLRACAILGVRCIQLPFHDDQHAAERPTNLVWKSIERSLGELDALLIPGFPLVHPDHRWVTTTALERRPNVRLGLYVEQPYAFWELAGHLRRGVRIALWTAQLLRTPGARRKQGHGLASELVSAVGDIRWETAPLGASDRVAKLRAIRAHRSQLQGFGPWFIPQLLLYEWAAGGETIAWEARERAVTSTST